MNRSLCVVLLACCVISCGKADLEDATDRVAARVNGDEIRMHQITGIVENNGGPAASAPQARRMAPQILERLIDQTLLVQQALADRLDRDPIVLKAIEDERRRILAQTYLERSVVGAYRPKPEEVHKFYQDNPVLFASRRIYRTNELTAAVPAEQIGLMKSQNMHARSLADVAAWLRSHDLPFQAAATMRPAEQIPFEMLARMATMKSGEIAVFATTDHVSAVELIEAEDAALSEAQATPIIERYLGNRKRIELAQAAVKKLRDAARIEYLGEFSGRGAAPELFKPVSEGDWVAPGTLPLPAEPLRLL